MKIEMKMQLLQQEKNMLSKIDPTETEGELFLKTQCYNVVNLIKDIDPDIGEILKNDMDTLWSKYYDNQENWRYTETLEGVSAIEIKRQAVEFKSYLIQQLHRDICNTIQNGIDRGEILV